MKPPFTHIWLACNETHMKFFSALLETLPVRHSTLDPFGTDFLLMYMMGGEL